MTDKTYPYSNSNWEQYLKKLFDLVWVGREGQKSPFTRKSHDDKGHLIDEQLSFNQLSLKTKVEVLYHLCEYRLYAEDSQNLVAHLVEDELRLTPLAHDSKGNVYWYFYGTRLYRETPEAVKVVDQKLQALEKALNHPPKPPPEKKGTKEPPKKKPCREYIPGERSSTRERKKVEPLQIATPKTQQNGLASSKKSSSSTITPDSSTSCGVALEELKKAWYCCCDTAEEWRELHGSLRNSKSAAEVELRDLIENNFLPKIEEIQSQAEKKKALETKRKLLEFLPRRTSSRQLVLKSKKEEDEKKEMDEFESRKRVSAQADERRKREQERLRLEEIKKAREQRAHRGLIAIETRAERHAALRDEPIVEEEEAADVPMEDQQSNSLLAHE